jgi:hypothetical protein
MKKILISSLLTLSTLSITAFADGELVKTRIGDLSFTHSFEAGYPTDDTSKKLLNEMDFQRACQAYIWSTPFVSFAQWHYSEHTELGAKNGQIVYQEHYEDKLGGLTFNATTPYVFPIIDVTKEPWIIVIPGPDGQIRGAAHDMWQIGMVSMVKPGKYLFVGPGQEVPKDAKKEGFIVVKSTSNNIIPGIRLMSEDPAQRLKILKNIDVYPYTERKNPKPRGFIKPNGKKWMAAAPRGLEYWERLADYINREPVAERDRLFLATLVPLGIEKGKKFNPTPEQKKILIEAALVGEAMAKANAFGNPRLVGGHYLDGSKWTFPATSPSNQRRENYDALDGRAAWFYEAVTNNYAMHGHESGKGQVYMGTYKDSDGKHLDGAKDYILHLPANVPAKVFWSLTAYEVDTRTLINTKYEKGDLSSRMNLLTNEDGSIDVYMGPNRPNGKKEKNWIPTEAGRAWFLYFRLYSPKKAFLDKSWVIPNIEIVK